MINMDGGLFDALARFSPLSVWLRKASHRTILPTGVLALTGRYVAFNVIGTTKQAVEQKH